MVARAYFEPIKTIAFGAISATYATVGPVTGKEVRVFCITNNTQGDLFFTTDASIDQMFLAAKSYRLYDVQANMNTQKDDSYVLSVGTQFSVKQITAPISGAVYIECIY